MAAPAAPASAAPILTVPAAPADPTPTLTVATAFDLREQVGGGEVRARRSLLSEALKFVRKEL